MTDDPGFEDIRISEPSLLSNGLAVISAVATVHFQNFGAQTVIDPQMWSDETYRRHISHVLFERIRDRATEPPRRKLKASWTLETAEDLREMHLLPEGFEDRLKREIEAELDADFIHLSRTTEDEVRRRFSHIRYAPIELDWRQYGF